MSESEPRGELVLQTLAMPADTNANRDIFGGWLMAKMDLGAGIIAKKVSKSRTVTVSIKEVIFKNPVYVGDVVTVYAEIEKIGRTSMCVHVEVWRTCFRKEDVQKVTEAQFFFVAVDKNGKPHAVKKEDREGE